MLNSPRAHSQVGRVLGSSDGAADGSLLGKVDGLALGNRVGVCEGLSEG